MLVAKDYNTGVMVLSIERVEFKTHVVFYVARLTILVLWPTNVVMGIQTWTPVSDTMLAWCLCARAV